MWDCHTSVAIDSNNKVHISYYDATNYALKYAVNASGDWVTSTIDGAGDVGQFSSIAVDSNNQVHISYYDATNHALKYATDASGDWITSTIDGAGDVGQFSSIAIDSNNKVHISYYDATNYALKYATECLRGLGYVYNRRHRRCGTVLFHSSRLKQQSTHQLL